MTDTAEFVPTPVPTEEELASFNPRDIPSSSSTVGDVRIDELPPLAGLPSDMRERVRAKLSTVASDHDIFERQFVREELEANSYRVKVLAGLHAGANEYERVSFGIVREVYYLQKEADRISGELDEVVAYDTAEAADGSRELKPVHRYQQELRRAREAALQDVQRQIRLLEGTEGAKLKSEAAKVVQARIADQNERLSEDREVRRLAAEKQRDNRINARVDKIVENRKHEMR